MKLGRLNHIGVATPSIEESISYYRDVMGAGRIRDPFEMEEQGVKVCFVDTPGENGTFGTQIELIEPLGEQSPIHKFLERNPKGGQHHICFEVPDIIAARDAMRERGATVLGTGEPYIGAHGVPVIFVHPKDTGGVLVELMQDPALYDGEGGH